MPYEPLHHKYRPQTFAELVGQESVTTTLTNALRQQRIAPAYLFTGARGTGKTSSARILAKSLNCLSSSTPTHQPCGKCEVCRMIANGSALDVIEIDAASNTGVDNIRELIERAQFAPVQCRYKVYVVDECHMLSTAAFNALLKTLEEPPDRVVFVLATTDPQRVLPTIISRCQRFDFRRIPLDAMVQHLGKIAAKEAIDITSEAIQLVAQISQGGLRDAQSLLDQLSLLDGQITAERVWDLVGAVPERDLLALVQAIAKDDATTVIDRARRLMDRGREPLIVLQNLASFYRDLLIAKTSPDRQDLIAVTPSTWAEMCGFTQQLPLSTILQGQQHLRESEGQVKNTTQPRLWLEVALLGLLPSAIGIQEVHSVGTAVQVRGTVAQPIETVVQQRQVEVQVSSPQVKQPQSTPGKGAAEVLEELVVERVAEGIVAETVSMPVEPVIPSQAERATPIAEIEEAIAPVPPEISESQFVEPVIGSSAIDLEQVWQDVIAQIKFRGTQVLLQQQSFLLAFDGREARIGIKSQPLFQMAKKQLSNIENAFEAIYQQKIRISLEVNTTAEASSRIDRRATNGNGSGTSSPPRKPIAKESPAPSSFPAKPTHHASPSQPSHPLEGPDFAVSPEVSEPVAPVWQEEDEVKGAARSVAQFFNGEIVSLEDELPIAPQQESALSPETTEVDEVDGDPDEDVPF